MTQLATLEVPVTGMDCAECTEHVRHAIAALPGVATVDVFLAAEKASIRLDPAQVNLGAIRKAVQDAGYRVPEEALQPDGSTETRQASHQVSRQVGALLAGIFGVILFVTIVGEWLGLFEQITTHVPRPIGLIAVLAAGYPVFRNVVRATLRRQIISHTLMTLGVIAALAVGQWATALVVVFFMRVGDTVEHFTTERARHAVKNLAALAPQTARVERGGQEVELPAGEVRTGEIVIVRPGEQIPADGEVVAGHATINQAAITGEALPMEAGPGSHVYAATVAQFGSIRVRVTGVGAETTFGRVIKLVERAEANRAVVQRIADKFSGYYLPIVAGIAALTFVLRRDPLATAAVLVVACSCSFALATPIAMLASIGAAARRGLLIKGGRYLETLARADVLLIDKTGTVTLGRPRITDIVITDHRLRIEDEDNGRRNLGLESAISDVQSSILRLAASAERYSEHPLAEAVRAAAAARGITLVEPQDFRAVPGLGVQAAVDGVAVAVGNREFMEDVDLRSWADLSGLTGEGRTLLYVSVDGRLAGILAAADTLRPEVPAALAKLRTLGVRRIELLTGDNAQAAAALAGQLGIPYRASLLPEDKIRIVGEYQAQGHTVIMVGDGVNDAPALAQADVGIAMGAAGSDIAIEAAHVALLRDDWTLMPELFSIARRTMGVVKMNLGFTAIYNIVGLTLAALGILPPMLAAAAQSLPDLGILGNSARLLRQELRAP